MERGVYFALHPDCVLVRGARRGAIYNLGTGEIFSIDPTAVALLDACEQAKPVAAIPPEIPQLGEEQINGYLAQLAQQGLGNFVEQPPAPMPVSAPCPYAGLDFLWLELREDCNLRCRHCYCGSQPGSRAQNRLTFEEWSRILREAFSLGCGAVQMIGGEPLLFGDRLFELAERASQVGYTEIGIFSNLTFLKDRWIDEIIRLKIHVSYSLYGRRPEVHDLVTRIPGSFQRTMSNVQRLRERGILPRPCVTIMKHNQDHLEETMAFLRELGDPNPGFDVVRPSGRGQDADLVPEKVARPWCFQEQAEFMEVDRETFRRRTCGNGCWQGKLTISSTGDVYPCIMQRDEACGNVRDLSLRQIIDGPIRKYWGLSFDQIEVCRDCEYRYACPDCRPIAFGSTGRLTAKPPHCSYDPYRGETVKEAALS